MRLGKIGLLVLWLGLPSCHITPAGSKTVQAKDFTAKVIRIIDGDTMEVRYENQPVKIRLAHIDCPEKRGTQPFGNEAKVVLSDLCFGQMVHVKVESYDRNKRLIAVVVNNKLQIVNQEMVKQGMAWHFKKYSGDSVYAQLETHARLSRTGLWKLPNAVPPWEWRKHKRTPTL